MTSDAGELLRQVMSWTGTSQSALARVSGVRQPTISQILSGRVGVSDDQLRRLLAGMGYELEVLRRPVRAELTRSELRSWRLHRRISSRLTRSALADWTPTLEANLVRLAAGTRGEPHEGNLRAWRQLVRSADVVGLHRALTGLDRRSIEMREVSPFAGILSAEERLDVLREAG